MIYLRYFQGNTFLHKLDPRAKLLILLFFIFVELAFRDVRIIFIPFVAALVLYFSARIPFKEVKGTWRFMVLLIVVIGGINGVFLFAFPGANAHVIGRYWIFTVTVEGISAAAAAILKLLAVAVATVTMVLTTDPSLYGPSLAKMGVPYKGAYVFDLAMRYLPAYVNDLETTLNAQMARGYKTKGGKNIFATIINTIPLIIPVSINAMLSVYEVADAMELRAFGAKKQRTWFRTVAFKKTDYAVVAAVASMLVLFIYLRTLYPGIWVPA
ncbi:MAG: energy-coupling factor transporter transmembrane protein EcfT [Nitrososphaerota archaeon]|nr:energy-coupling factor transporter transmembrane protein EcfT [Nitrososphaerota archaeon]MDG6956131.1 energy-coupling factor transporter transmembrane protein EcfT [Nitrososphaerota archaeon]MDG6958926.1 energy-coupling factor transporter transmembrane protein EcfT [Nitrososphaerota archaeon]MDG6960136.1 energy-coupling factor transporter transmembrane protein EcfT [Nitrososphaerota archaeon]